MVARTVPHPHVGAMQHKGNSIGGNVHNIEEVVGEDPRPYRDQAREMLRREILSGRLAPGTRLLERQLATAMGISRIPVREAIRMLESERLVVVNAHRGAFVRMLSAKEIEDLFDLREALDVLEARLAAQRSTPRGLELLARFYEEAAEALAAGSIDTMNEANAQFHLQVAELADNEALASVLEPVSTRLHWLYAQNQEPERVLKEHKALLTAISQGRPDKAADVALRHVQASRRMVMAKLAAADGEAVTPREPAVL